MADEILPSELLQVIRLSIRATATSNLGILTDDDSTFNPRSPALRKLVEAVLYSRRFVLTYYAVLGLLLGACAVKRLFETRRARHARRKDAADTPSSYDSTTSTLRESQIPDNGEYTPLLPKEDHTLRSRLDPLRAVSRHIRAAMMYQPHPLPSFTSPKNLMPSNAASLLVALLLGLNIFYLLFRTALSIPMLFAFADRAGLCFVINLPVLYLLGAKTNQSLQVMTGWSYEGLNLFHRRLGEWMTALAAMHSLGMVGVWYTLLRPLHFTLYRFLSGRVGFLGTMAFVSYLAIYFSSIGWVRRLVYERFLLLHVVLQVTALVFLFFHHHNSRPYVVASLAIWTLDRLFLRTFVSARKYIATLEVASDQQTVLLYCDVLIKANSWFGKSSMQDGWTSSQHVFVTVPGLGMHHRFQAHPFTIASPAPPVGHDGLWQLQLIIRAQDGFSRELLTYAVQHQHTEIVLDGPYGATDALDALEAADRVCLIAGGSGIAVTYPLSWPLHVDPWSSSVLSRRTIHQDGRRLDSPNSAIHALSKTKHRHIWIRQNASADQWLSLYLHYMTLRPSSKSNGSILEPDLSAAADLVDSRFETAGDHALRPDLPTELYEWAMHDQCSPSAGRPAREKLVVVVSGPDGMVRTVRNACASLTRDGVDVQVFVEKFGW
jgi:hypothetical protein